MRMGKHDEIYRFWREPESREVAGKFSGVGPEGTSASVNQNPRRTRID
jgi:hypothetical protein